MGSEEYDIRHICEGKCAAIFGTGASGRAAQALLDSLGIESKFYAQNTPDGNASSISESAFDETSAKNHKLVVYSPAFRPDHEWIRLADRAGACAICEPDLAALAWRGKIVAITGTNGKTTLTSFISHALKHSGVDAVSAGNIGMPLSLFAAEDKNFGKEKIAVCELSSFQTSRLKFLRPDSLIWTNFAPDHLDWHINLKEYFNAKYNLVSALKTQRFYAGYSVAEASLKLLSQPLPGFAKIFDENSPEKSPPPFSSSIQARNFTMAKAFLSDLGIEKEAIIEAAKSFKLPQYRFGSPVFVGDMAFYNDSKATNAHAAIAALRELRNEKNLVWIGGGKNKFCELDELVNELYKTAKGAILIGETAKILSERLKGLPLGAREAKDMQTAVNSAYKMANGHGCALFSPAFSSFGMFSGYAERGKCFDSAVLCLKNLK